MSKLRAILIATVPKPSAGTIAKIAVRETAKRVRQELLH
jgi:hypothetical protein